MPLIRLSADEAIQNRKTNPFSGWGDRGAPNRVEPVTAPGFDVGFLLRPGEAIFTIGSCFARNVERELLRLGFEIPSRSMFTKPEFKDIESGVINNFGTPSIYNEIAWAFGEREFVAEDHIIEVAPGRFVDQQIMPTLRPDTREKVLARRTAISESYGFARNCRVIIITLGLSEVWFDTKSGYYLNVAPRPTAIRAYPDRYELHVLGYEEVYGFLRDSLLLLQEHGHSDLRILLTVSPVPLSSTHRPADVIVANSYSKAVLRTAAETAVATLPFVTYYPSYESVVLSDRKLAWLDDMRHVSDAMVQLNVSRMIEAYVGDVAAESAVELAVSEADAIMGARVARETGAEKANAYFARNAEWSTKSAAFASEHARVLLDQGRPDDALEVLGGFAAGGDAAIMALTCEALLATGRENEALAILDRTGKKKIKAVSLWHTIFRAALATENSEVVRSVLNRLMANVRVSPNALLLAARHFRSHGELDAAIRYYELSKELDDRSQTVLELADALVDAGRPDNAKQAIEGLVAETAGEVARLDRLRMLLG